MKVKGSLDVSELYDLVFKFDECVDTSFKETTTELDTIRSCLSRQGQEIANLEGSYDILEKEIKTLRELLKSLQEMGEKDKEQNPTPAGIYSKESVGKVT